jgi:PKD repeat protein
MVSSFLGRKKRKKPVPRLRPPEADFTAEPVSGIAPLSVQFTDQSKGEIAGWVWDFGDGVKSVEQHPKHTYAETGTYTVSLIVSNAAGSNTESKVNFVTIYPIMEEWYPEDVIPYDILTLDISTLLELTDNGKVVLGEEFKEHTGLRSYLAEEVTKLSGDVWEARKQVLQTLVAKSNEIESQFNTLKSKLNSDGHAMKAKELRLIDVDEKVPRVEQYLQELRTALNDGLEAIRFRDEDSLTQLNARLWMEFQLFTLPLLTEDYNYWPYPATVRWRKAWLNLHCDHDGTFSVSTTSEPTYQHYQTRVMEICPICKRIVSIGSRLEVSPYCTKLFQAEKNKVNFAYVYAYECDDRATGSYTGATHIVLIYPTEKELEERREYYSSEQNYQETGILFGGQKAGVKLDGRVEYLSLKYKDNALCLSLSW